MKINRLWIVCLITRICLLLLAGKLSRNKSNSIRTISSIVLLIIGGGFIYKYLYGSNNEVQVAKVFWHETRILHGMLYILASYYLYIKNSTMCMLVLGLDILSSILYRIFTNQ
jgi:hypothetical protein